MMTFVLVMESPNGFISPGFMRFKLKRMMVLMDSSIKLKCHVKLGSAVILTEEPIVLDVFIL